MRILYVESNAHEMEIILELLQGQGYEVYTAITGEEAITQAILHSPEIILINYSLPDMKSLEFYRKVALYPTLDETTFIHVVPDSICNNDFFLCVAYGSVLCGPLSSYKEQFNDYMRRFN